MHDGMTFNFDSTKCVHLPYLIPVSLMTKIYGLQQLLHSVFYIIVLFLLTAILQLKILHLHISYFVC